MKNSRVWLRRSWMRLPRVVTNVGAAQFGNFPLWLAPEQVRVITLNDDEALIAYAKPIVAELRANMVRVDADFSATPFKAKIANAEQLRVHTMLVIGGRDMEAGAVSIRLHGKGNIGAKPKADAIAEILTAI